MRRLFNFVTDYFYGRISLVYLEAAVNSVAADALDDDEAKSVVYLIASIRDYRVDGDLNKMEDRFHQWHERIKTLYNY
jgi:hypothetical protein